MTQPKPWERPTWNEDFWEGRKPLAPPDPKGAVIELLGVVWERKPEDPTADFWPRGGIVVRIDRNDDGEQVVTCLNSRGKGGRARVVLYTLPAEAIEPTTIQPSSTASLSQAVRRICRDLGQPLDSTYLTRHEIDLLNLAIRLVGEHQHSHDDRRAS